MTVTEPTIDTVDETSQAIVATRVDGATEIDGPGRPDLVEDDLVEEDLLVEEISIDGMCGVY